MKELEQVQSLVEDFLRRLHIAHDAIEVITDVDAHPILFVRTTESHRLIGSHGDTLRALNLILKLITVKQLGEAAPRFMVDVNGYHTKRLRDLRKNAEILAERVRMFRSPIEMSPMSAYERMIVHSVFANDPVISTTSEGEGKFRHVVLKYEPKQTQGEPAAV